MPAEIVEGVLLETHKMLLTGPSKANKTWGPHQPGRERGDRRLVDRLPLCAAQGALHRPGDRPPHAAKANLHGEHRQERRRQGRARQPDRVAFARQELRPGGDHRRALLPVQGRRLRHGDHRPGLHGAGRRREQRQGHPRVLRQARRDLREPGMHRGHQPPPQQRRPGLEELDRPWQRLRRVRTRPRRGARHDRARARAGHRSRPPASPTSLRQLRTLPGGASPSRCARFAPKAPLDMWFTFPLHTVDSTGLLEDCKPNYGGCERGQEAANRGREPGQGRVPGCCVREDDRLRASSASATTPSRRCTGASRP